MSIGWGLFLTLKGATTTIQFTANIAGLVGGGVLGLFLLGLIGKRVTIWMAAVAVTFGVLLITWMTVSRLKLGATEVWPVAWNSWRSPWHEMLAGPLGTVAIIIIGLMLGAVFGSPLKKSIEAMETTI